MARAAQIFGEGAGRAPRVVLQRRRVRIELGEARAPVAGERLPARRFRGGQRLARPLLIGLVEQREVEQPFAGIVDDVDVELGRTAAPAARPVEAQRQPQFRDAPGRLRPVPLRPFERRQMLLIRKAWHRVVWLRIEPRPGDPPLRARRQHGQPLVGEQVLDQRRHEHGLARPRQARDPQPERAALQIIEHRARHIVGFEGETGKKRHAALGKGGRPYVGAMGGKG